MEIKITRKRIKNIIIRVNSEGEVLISAPLKVPKHYIESIVKEKESWIREKITLVQRKKARENLYENGDSFFYLGREYPVVIESSTEEFCKLEQGRFLIATQENSFENRKKLIDQWVYQNFYPHLIELTMDMGERIGYTPTKIKFRDMKTRWGSCNTLTRSITYNHQLYKKPIEAVEYVVLHELAHIPYPHHQRSFWEFVEKYMPDWKNRRKLLKELRDE